MWCYSIHCLPALGLDWCPFGSLFARLSLIALGYDWGESYKGLCVRGFTLNVVVVKVFVELLRGRA